MPGACGTTRPGNTRHVASSSAAELIGPREGEAPHFDGRGHFFAAAAEAMRRILVERARKRGTKKRGGGGKRLDLDPDTLMLDEVPAEFLDLDDALSKLAKESPVVARLVNLRFFAGLMIKQTAAALGVSVATANRHLAYARAWPFDALADSGEK